MNPEQIVQITTGIACNRLTDNELVAINMAIQAGKSNLESVMDYEKVKHLFANGKPHKLVADAIVSEYMRRIEITNAALRSLEEIQARLNQQ